MTMYYVIYKMVVVRMLDRGAIVRLSNGGGVGRMRHIIDRVCLCVRADMSDNPNS